MKMNKSELPLTMILRVWPIKNLFAKLTKFSEQADNCLIMVLLHILFEYSNTANIFDIM